MIKNSLITINDYIYKKNKKIQPFEESTSGSNTIYNNKKMKEQIENQNIEMYEREQNDEKIINYVRCLMHDVRSPINNISMGIEILKELTKENNDVNNLIMNIETSCEYVTNTISNFLKIKNIQEIKKKEKNEDLQINNELFDILYLLYNTEKLLIFKINNKNIRIKYILNGINKTSWVWGNPTNIEHVFLNLLSNAVKFAYNNSKITINVKSEIVNENIQKVTISILDENKHIPASIKKNLFQKYNTSDDKTGTGLGLYICKEIVELYKGYINHSYSYIPYGNKFTFEMTFNTMSPNFMNNELLNNVNKTKVKSIKITVPNNKLKSLKEEINKKILIIDDSEISRKMLKQFITFNNDKIEIIESENGLNAINYIHEKIDEVGLIFTDNNMPVMNGLLLIKILRALGYKGYIIGVTGTDHENFLNDFYNIGADFVMTKPIVKTIFDKLFNVLYNTGFKRNIDLKINYNNNEFYFIPKHIYTIEENNQISS